MSRFPDPIDRNKQRCDLVDDQIKFGAKEHQMASKLRTGLLASCALATIQLMGASTASAQGYCSVASEPGLSLGCARTLVDASLLLGFSPANRLINPIIGSHDGLVFDSDWITNSGNPRLRFDGNVKSSEPRYSSWTNTYFGSARTDGGKTALEITAFEVPESSTAASNTVVELEFDRLTLENTAVTLRDGASDDGRQTGQIS